LLVFGRTFEEVKKLVFGGVDLIVFDAKQSQLVVHVSPDSFSVVVDILSEDVLLLVAHDAHGIGGLELVLCFDECSGVTAPLDRVSGLTAVDLD
jgi:hypothetical protein